MVCGEFEVFIHQSTLWSVGGIMWSVGRIMWSVRTFHPRERWQKIIKRSWLAATKKTTMRTAREVRPSVRWSNSYQACKTAPILPFLFLFLRLLLRLLRLLLLRGSCASPHFFLLRRLTTTTTTSLLHSLILHACFVFIFFFLLFFFFFFRENKIMYSCF